MHELISLAKDNAILVIGLLVATFYLQDRLDAESSSIRQEMSDMRTVMFAEFSSVRQDVAGLKQDMTILQQDVAGLKQDVSDLRQEVSAQGQRILGLGQDMSGLRQEVSGLREDLHSFQLETTDRFARIETLLGQPAQAI